MTCLECGGAVLVHRGRVFHNLRADHPVRLDETKESNDG